MMGALIAIGAWIGFLVVILAFLIVTHVDDDQQTLWRCDVDPSGLDTVDELEFHLLLPDATPGAW